MSSFWSDLKDNAALVGAAALDAANPANWIDGTAPLTAALAEAQNAEREGREFSQKRADDSAKGGLRTIGKAAEATADDVKKKAEVGFGWLPWILGGAAVVVTLVAVAPYIAPAKAVVEAAKKAVA